MVLYFTFFCKFASMKKKFQIFLMILSLAIFMLPKQNLFAQTSKSMDCCKTEQSENCHGKQKEKQDCEHQKSSHSDCSGNCCNNCGSCSAFFVSFVNPDTYIQDKEWFINDHLSDFNYISPFLSTGLQEIWQPPKIG